MRWWYWIWVDVEIAFSLVVANAQLPSLLHRTTSTFFYSPFKHAFFCRMENFVCHRSHAFKWAAIKTYSWVPSIDIRYTTHGVLMHGNVAVCNLIVKVTFDVVTAHSNCQFKRLKSRCTNVRLIICICYEMQLIKVDAVVPEFIVAYVRSGGYTLIYAQSDLHFVCCATPFAVNRAILWCHWCVCYAKFTIAVWHTVCVQRIQASEIGFRMENKNEFRISLRHLVR